MGNFEIYVLQYDKPSVLTNHVFGSERKVNHEKIVFKKIGKKKTVKTIGNPNCDTNYLCKIYKAARGAGTNAVLLKEMSSYELKPSIYCGNDFCGMWSEKRKKISIQPIKITGGLDYLELYKIPDSYLNRFPELAQFFQKPE